MLTMKALFHFQNPLSPPSIFPNHSPFPHRENGNFLGSEIITSLLLTNKSHTPYHILPAGVSPTLPTGYFVDRKPRWCSSSFSLRAFATSFILPGILYPQDLPWAKLYGCQPLKWLLFMPGTCISGVQVASTSSCLSHHFLGED